MKNSQKDKQVLLAILNVKKYAKNLKKKASNLQEGNDDFYGIQAISSPSFNQPLNNDGIYDLNSPLLYTKSSYNESFESFIRQKKQHSMTSIPGSKKMDKDSRKNSDAFASTIISPSKTYNYSNQRIVFSQSYQIQSSDLKQDKMIKKQRKDSCQTQSKIVGISKQKQRNQIINQGGIQQTNSTMGQLQKTKQISTKSSVVFAPAAKKIQEPKLIEQLLQEISTLKSQICDYKKALIILKTKYFDMEQKCSKKIQSDHLLDELKIKIQLLMQQKQLLMQTINQQNLKIIKFQQSIIQISKKFSQHFSKQLGKITSLQTENSIYKQLIFIKSPKVIQNEVKKEPQLQDKKTKIANHIEGLKQKQINDSSQSQTQTQNYIKPFAINKDKICKTLSDIQTKYCEYKIQQR